VEEELPAVVAEDPEGRTVGDNMRCRGAIGGERYVLCQRLDVVVANGGVARFTLEQSVDDLLAIEDSAGDAELLELIGEEGYQGGAIALAVGVKETFFERVEMILKFRVGHAWRSNCYTNGGAMGFRCGFAGKGIFMGLR
jgi:hypothetical protein